MNISKYTIEQVHFGAKWAEFRFAELMPSVSTGGHHASVKTGDVWPVIESAGLYNHVMNHGLVGIQSTWTKGEGEHWQLVGLIRPNYTRFQLEQQALSAVKTYETDLLECPVSLLGKPVITPLEGDDIEGGVVPPGTLVYDLLLRRETLTSPWFVAEITPTPER